MSVLGLVAGRPDAVFYVPGAVGTEADRAACLASYYEAQPDLAGDIGRIIDRDFSNKIVLDDFLSHLGSYSDLQVIAMENRTGADGWSHDAALRQARASGITTLFELAQMRVDFDFDYGGKDCEMRPVVDLQYRFINVERDRQLMAGHIRQQASFPEPMHSGTISQRLGDGLLFANAIEHGFGDAITQAWYANVPSQ